MTQAARLRTLRLFVLGALLAWPLHAACPKLDNATTGVRVDSGPSDCVRALMLIELEDGTTLSEDVAAADCDELLQRALAQQTVSFEAYLDSIFTNAVDLTADGDGETRGEIETEHDVPYSVTLGAASLEALGYAELVTSDDGDADGPAVTSSVTIDCGSGPVNVPTDGTPTPLPLANAIGQVCHVVSSLAVAVSEAGRHIVSQSFRILFPPRNACLSDGDCADGDHCKDGACRAGEEANPCDNNFDCDDGLICVNNFCSTGRAGQVCRDGLDCTGICDQPPVGIASCVSGGPPTACTADDQCAGGFTCQLLGTCGECFLDGDCAASPCIGGVCGDDLATCVVPADCASGDCVGGRCAECQFDFQCLFGERCSGGRCVECVLDGDCGFGNVCDALGSCVPE
jgi:hypothetical protein